MCKGERLSQRESSRAVGHTDLSHFLWARINTQIQLEQTFSILRFYLLSLKTRKKSGVTVKKWIRINDTIKTQKQLWKYN